jgi:peptidoglycan/xylan/chitin deacetylase (PgdA/CDA1 family)
VILLYHGVVEDGAPPERWSIGQALPVGALERQLLWLKANRRLVPLSDYLAQESRNGAWLSRTVAVTFDDGLASAFARAFPVLVRHRIPATFFISTGHLEGGPLLWFAYLNALCFEEGHGEVELDGKQFPLRSLEERTRARWGLGALARASGDPGAFAEGLAARYPLSPGVASEYQGMTHEQVTRLASSPGMEVGSHTVTHPFLGQLPPGDQARELAESKRELEALIGRPVRYFAYPAGDYSRETLSLVRSAGYDAALATIPRKLESDGLLEVERIGVYSRPLWKLQMKALGVASLARWFGMSVG